MNETRPGADTPSFAEELRYAELLVRTGLCTRDRVDAGLKELRKRIVEGAEPRPSLSGILVERGDLSQAQAQSAVIPSSVDLSVASAYPPDVQAAATIDANHVGKYVKVSKLGSGGMGEVWKSWDGELRRWVALKFVRPEASDQGARFRREAQMAARLHHPNIAAVYEVGESAGRPYIAMQYVPGRPLSAVDNLTPRLAAKLIREAALAIHTAHEQGTVHRDLKPDNVMVVDEGGNRKAVVLDFGLARPLDGGTKVSITGAVVGTPLYMAPEQARADNARIGPATDVYGLGATLYEALARRPPFRTGDPLDVLRRVVEEDPAPLRAVDRELGTIVMKCLAKEPERRYPSAFSLAQDLGRWLAGEPIQSRPAGIVQRAWRFLSRRKPVAIASTLGVGAIVFALIFSAVRERSLTSTTAGREQYLLQLGGISTDLSRSREWIRQSYRKPSEVRDEMLRVLRAVDALVNSNPRQVQGWILRAKGRLSLHDLTGAEADLRAALQLDNGYAPAWSLLARVQLELQQLRKSQYRAYPGDPQRQWLLELQAAIEESLRRGKTNDGSPGRWGLPTSPEDRVDEGLLRAMWLAILDKNPAGAVALLLEEHRLIPSEEYARFIGLWSGNPDERRRWLEDALRIAPHYAAGLLDQAMLCGTLGDWRGAESGYTSVIDLQPDLAVAWNNRAYACFRQGNDIGAQRDFDEAVRRSPKDAAMRFVRGTLREWHNNVTGALTDYEMAIELNPEFADAIIARASLRVRSNDASKVETELQRTLSRMKNKVPLLVARAAWYRELGYPGKEMADALQAVQIDSKDPNARIALGNAFITAKDYVRALENFEKALELDPQLSDAWRGRAACRNFQGDLASAEADLNRAIELDPASHQAYSDRAYVRRMLGNQVGAASDFEQVRRLDVRSPQRGVYQNAVFQGLQRSPDAPDAPNPPGNAPK